MLIILRMYTIQAAGRPTIIELKSLTVVRTADTTLLASTIL